MKQLLSETRVSLTDPNFGKVILKKSLKESLVYWTKYLLLISLALYILLFFFITYSVPRLPKYLNEFLPSGQITAQNNLLSTTIKQPLSISFEGFTITSDLEASASAIDSLPAGVLLLKDRYISKSPTGELYSHTYGEIPDFSISKETAIQYISDHRLQIWGITSVLSLGLVIISAFLTWFSRQFTFLLSALFVWLVSRHVFRRHIDFLGSYKLIIYASILPMVLSAILLVIPNDLLAALNFGFFVYLIFSWVRNLPPYGQPLSQKVAVNSPKIKALKKRSPRSKRS